MAAHLQHTHDRGKTAAATTAAASSSSSSSAASSFPKRFAAGGGAGVVTKLATAPLERAKALMQLQGMRGFVGGRAKYRTVMGTMRRVAQEEGPMALYRGCGANILRIAPAYAFKFSLTDHFKAAVAHPGQKTSDLSLQQLIAATTLAGLVQTAATYPLESLRQRLYMSDSLGAGLRGSGIPHCIRRTYQLEGVRGFYRGLCCGLATGAPFVGVEMSSYELLTRCIPESSTGVQRMPFHFVCGAVAGVLTQTVLYPLDTVWRRMMANGEWNTPPKYRSSFHCVVVTVQEEGYAGLFRGVGANAMRAFPAAGIQFLVYDLLKQFLMV